MSALHDAARRVVSAWVSTRPAWLEQCNEAVLALDAALKAEPAQEPSESSCDECGKSKVDGWALYCVECLEQFFRPAEPAQEPVSVDQRVMPLMESALQAVAEKIGDQCAVWYGIGARDVEAVLREAARHGLVRTAHPEPAPTVEFDHGIGADRFKVVRGSYWWHILIGDSPIKRGKFHTQAGAEEMVALLLREFRNGAFVQHNTAPPQQPEPAQEADPTDPGHDIDVLREHVRHLERRVRELHAQQAKPAQEPVAWMVYTLDGKSVCVTDNPADFTDEHKALPLYATPQPETAQREPVAWMYHGIRHDGTPHDRPSLIWRPEYMDAMSASKGAQATPLYTTPQPQRPPLTNEEIVDAVREADLDWQAGWTLDEHEPNRFTTLARAIERKVRGE